MKKRHCAICKKKIKKNQEKMESKHPEECYHKRCWNLRKRMMVREIIRNNKYREMDKYL